MSRYVTVFCAALIAAAAFIGTSGEANARCSGCGPIPPVYNYRTVHKVVNRTQFHDVRRTSHVLRLRRIFNVTRVQPIVRVHTVTRVHHYTVPVVRNVYVNSVQTLPPHYVGSNSVQNYYHGCGCR